MLFKKRVAVYTQRVHMKFRSWVLLFTLLVSANVFSAWSLDWTGEPGYETDGVEPDEGLIGAPYNFRIRFVADDPTLRPQWVRLLIDLNEDGKFGKGEEFELRPDPDERDIWSLEKKISIHEGKTQRQHIAYYFQAMANNEIKTSMLTYGPIVGGFNNSFIIEGQGWFIEEALFPLELKTMAGTEQIVITNTSNTALTVALSLPKDFPGPFHPLEDIESQEVNGFVISAVVTDSQTEQVDEESFNQSGSEDVITFEKKIAKNGVFGIGKRSDGETILPGESVYVWLQIRAPATTQGEDAMGDQMVYIKLEVTPTNS